MEKNKNPQQSNWHLLDAKDQILGRLSVVAANYLRGKSDINFSNHQNCGDYVVIINAKDILLTGNKIEQKRYYKHTGYIGNLKTYTVKEMLEKKPEEVIKRSISGMLPHNKLKKQFLAKLKIYKDEKHPHQNIKFI